MRGALSWMVSSAALGTFVALAYASLGLLTWAAYRHRPPSTETPAAERRHRFLWLGLSLVLVGLGVSRLNLTPSFLALARPMAHALGWSKSGRVPRSAIAAAGFLGLGVGTAGFVAARRSPPLLCAWASALVLVALTLLRVVPFRRPGQLSRLVGGHFLELTGLVGMAVSAAWGAGLLSRGRRKRTIGISMAAAGVIVLGMAGMSLARSRSFVPSLSTGRAVADGVGGGFTAAGLDGEYFANADLRGSPAFMRRDVRIAFDWAHGPGPGGSVSPDFARVSADRFSARWTGKLVARFSEAYTFEVDADDGARLSLRQRGSDRWTAVVDKWTASGRHASAPITLQAGVPVDVKLEYRQTGGPARVQLAWSAASVPHEIIEPLARGGVNANSSIGYLGNRLYADAMKGGRVEWTEPGNDNPVPLDDDGWPLRDATIIAFEGAAQTRGTYRLSFEGQAEVATFPKAAMKTDGAEFDGLLPKGTGYDARTNVTHAILRLDDDSSILYLTFRKTQRMAGAPVGGGIRNVRLMRPVAPGASESYAPGTLFDRALEQSFSGFTALRWILNFDKEAHWAERSRPSQVRGVRGTEPTTWEYVVMLANETGRDLYICTPVNADDDYLQRVARLFRFGSDARGEPYESVRANPVFPPLNPNLRLYVERSNEIWNWSFSQAGDNQRQAADAVARDTADGRIVNFDQAAQRDHGGDLWLRWHALRTKQLADVFRRVFGEDAMGTRIRILYEYQYDNLQDSASDGLSFLDRYFNNADGESHVPDPHPVGHTLWGAGAAVYYGSGNPTGKQTAVVVPDGGFEKPQSTSPWKFEGTAGVYRISLLDAFHLRDAGPTSPPRGKVTGVRFRTGPRPLAVYEVGRLAGPDDKQTHAVRIIRADDRKVALSADIPATPKPAGPVTISRLGHPIVLPADTEYWLVSDEQPDSDRVHAGPVVDPSPALTMGRALAVDTGGSDDPAHWRVADLPGPATGTATFRFAIEPRGPLGFPPAPVDGQQAAFIEAKGAVSTTIDFGKGGTYAVQLHIAGRPDAAAPIDFEIDNRRITSYPGGRDPRVSSEPFLGGSRWAYDAQDLLAYTSTAVHTAGPHRIRIVGRGQAGQAVYLDAVSVVSIDAIFDGGMPGSGEASGQRGIDDYAKQVASQARYAQAFGLRMIAYEGGWSVGGDFDATTAQSAAKYLDPRAQVVQDRALQLLGKAGYGLTLWGTYDLWPTAFEAPALASRYPLVKSILEADDHLPPEADSGRTIPGEIDPAASTWAWPREDQRGELAHPGDLVSYRIFVPATGVYDVSVKSAGSGMLKLLIDGGLALSASGPAGRELTGPRVVLPKGMHTITLQSAMGSASIRSIGVAVSNQR